MSSKLAMIIFYKILYEILYSNHLKTLQIAMSFMQN